MLAILADDEIFIREALALNLSTIFKCQVLQAADAGETVQLCKEHNPQLVIMDLLMEGTDTFDAARSIYDINPAIKVIILSGRDEPRYLLRAKEAKARGYMLKGSTMEESIYAINTVLRGGFYVPACMQEHLFDPSLTKDEDELAKLTAREREVLVLTAKGNSIKEVASIMNISVNTAQSHRGNLGQKLGNPNKAQMIAFAIHHKLVTPN